MSTANLPMLSKWHELATRVSTPTGKSSTYPASWWVMLTVSCIALVTSSYLAWASFTSSSVAGCGGGSVFDCDHVLHSRWSTVLSVPVSAPAILTYVLILGMLLWQPVSKRWLQLRWSVIGLASLTAGAAALWFIALQVFWMQHRCPYCLVAHAAGIILAVTFLLTRPIDRSALRWVGGGAAVLLSCLIGLQTLSEAPPSYEVIEYPASTPASASAESTFAAPQSVENEPTLFEAPTGANATERTDRYPLPSQLSDQAASLVAALINPTTLFYGEVSADNPQRHTARILNNLTLDTSAWPIIGKPDAGLVFVELFDYTCEHCQKTHQSLAAARKQFGDRLAIITLPVPLDSQCNPTVKQTHAGNNEACELAKLAVAVWKTDNKKFAEFHDYLFDAKPGYSSALTKAQSLVDNDELDKILRSSLPSDYIAKDISLYQRAGAGQIPKLLFPNVTTVGAVESPATMISLINQHLR